MDAKGFTLIEVIIAALILSVTVGGAMFVFSSQKTVVDLTGRRFQAMEFTRETLEELKTEVTADTWDVGDPNINPFKVGHTYKRALPADSRLRTKFALNQVDQMRRYIVDNVGAVDPSTGYKTVSVTVEWDEPTE